MKSERRNMTELPLQTRVETATPAYKITPSDRLLFVGSCFADNIGRRFTDWQFRTVANPYGVMYNPASILHSVRRWTEALPSCHEIADIAVFTLGTSHVYILNETGEIVDNCQKRPQRLFTERILCIEECVDFLSAAIDTLKQKNEEIKVILTVSPIRYAKYGFHASQLSKATLLLAAEEITRRYGCASYFPAYEIVNDELRDYRFYKSDMIHPSDQAVDYIFGRFCDSYMAAESYQFMEEWKPIQQALAHRPFNPEAEEYKKFIAEARNKEKQFRAKWLCR